jgi:predicted RNA-binding protein with PIN domain
MQQSARLVLVDGYNVIRRSDALARAERRSLQNGRDALIVQLAARYGHGAQQIMIVFDGAGSCETRERRFGLTIIFTPAGVTADDCLVRLAAEARAQGRPVTVCTDDNGIRVALSGIAPDVQTQRATDLGQQMLAPSRLVEKQYRHRAAIKRIMAEREDPDADDARQHPKRGNPRRSPRKR